MEKDRKTTERDKHMEGHWVKEQRMYEVKKYRIHEEAWIQNSVLSVIGKLEILELVSFFSFSIQLLHKP